VAWRWFRLPLEVFFLGTAIPLSFCQTKIFRCRPPFRQIAKLFPAADPCEQQQFPGVFLRCIPF
jgi:hypothetical protein